MSVEDCRVELDTHVVEDCRVNFKDNGWLAVNDGDGWTYYPPHRVESVFSQPRGDTADS